MSRHPRFIPPISTVEITCRTIGGRFLLRPGDQMNEAILATLGRALHLVPVELHAFAFLSNHWHALLTTPDALALAAFMAHVHGNIARAAQRLYGWDGPVWKRHAETILVVDDDAAVERLRYIVAQGTKEALVGSPLDWPGVSSTRALAGGEALAGTWYDRRRAAQIRRAGREPNSAEVATRYPIDLVPLPAWSRYPPERRRAMIQALVASVEADARAAGAAPLGAEAVLAQDPRAAPAHFVPRPPPKVHASTAAAATAFRTLWLAFASAFRAAADEVRAASPPTFPSGAFPPAAAFVPWDQPAPRSGRGAAGPPARRVAEARHLAPGLEQVAALERLDHHAVTGRQLADDGAPGVDDERVPEALAALVVVAPLGGGDHPALVLDGPRPQQQVPVRPPGVRGEGGRHQEDLGAGVERQLAVELGEADVVADRHPHLRRPHAHHDRGLAGRRRVGLAQRGAAGDVDVEQVDLSIEPADCSRRGDDDRRVVGPPVVAGHDLR
jgi:putative transposase